VKKIHAPICVDGCLGRFPNVVWLEFLTRRSAGRFGSRHPRRAHGADGRRRAPSQVAVVFGRIALG